MSKLQSSNGNLDIDMDHENDEDEIDSIKSKSSDLTNMDKQNVNQRGECINLSIYNTNTIVASDPTPFASNDFISGIPNYEWHINDVTKDQSRANMGILSLRFKTIKKRDLFVCFFGQPIFVNLCHNCLRLQ